jgi:molybdate transport system regulatory protein
MVAVDLRTPCGQVLASLVTRESADLLGLAPGLGVLALCKATAVAVGPTVEGTTAQAQPGTGCTLQGVVADVSPGVGPQEVALTLPSGHLWVGFAPQTEGLVVGRAASGRFAPSAVVMGLAS